MTKMDQNERQEPVREDTDLHKRCAELEQFLDQRYNELVNLSRMLDKSEAERYRFKQRWDTLRGDARDFARNYDAVCESLSGRIGLRVMRLLMSPATLGRGHTVLDHMAEQRKKLPD
jgi:predicted nuclease with TOPRIM domain